MDYLTQLLEDWNNLSPNFKKMRYSENRIIRIFLDIILKRLYWKWYADLEIEEINNIIHTRNESWIDPEIIEDIKNIREEFYNKISEEFTLTEKEKSEFFLSLVDTYLVEID